MTDVVDPIVLRGRDESAGAFASLKGNVKTASSAVDLLREKFASLGGSGPGSAAGAINGVAEAVARVRGMIGIPGLVVAGIAAASILAHRSLIDVGKAADEAAVKAREMAGLERAVERVGGKSKNAADALRNLRKAAGEAASGEGEVVASLRELFKLNDVALTDAGGKAKSVSAIYDDVAQMILRAASQTDRLAIATLAFGEEAAPSMVKAILAGADSLDKFNKKGGEAFDSIVSKAREFDDLLRRLTTDSDGLISGLVEGIKAKALPVLGLMYEGLAAVMALGGNKRAKETAFMLSAQSLGEDVRRTMGPGDVDQFYRGVSSKFFENTTRIRVAAKPEGDPEALNAFSRAQDAIKKRIALEDAETATIGLNSEARARAKVVAELEEAAKRANTAAGAANADVTDQQRAAIDKMSQSMMEAAKRQRETRTAWEGVNEAMRYAGNIAVDIYDVMTDKAKSWADFTISAARSVGKELWRAALTGEGAFGKLLGTASANGGTGGLLGGLLGALGGASLAPQVGATYGAAAGGIGMMGGVPFPALADGGVIPARGLALVSEHKNPRLMRAGDEPIVVTPHDVPPPRRGGAPTYNDNSVYHLNAAGADPAAVARLERLVATMRASQKAVALAAISEHADRA